MVETIAGGSAISPGAIVNELSSRLTVGFSEPVSTAGGISGLHSVINSANWQILHNGVDVTSQITQIQAAGNATTARFEATLQLAAPLTAGSYSLTLRENVQDLDGEALDGDNNGAAGSDYRLGFTAPNFAPVGSEFRVNNWTTNDQNSPSIAVENDGDFIITWVSNYQDTSATGIYAQRYAADGSKRGAEFRVNTTVIGNQVSPQVAVDGDGDFVIVWASPQSNWNIFAQRYNAAGTPQGSEFRVCTFSTQGAREAPSVAMNANGDFVVAWHGTSQEPGSGIFAQRFDAAGAKVGGEFRVNTYTTKDQSSPSVAIDATGNFVVAWHSYQETSGNYSEVYFQRYNASGAAVGAETKANQWSPFAQRNSSVALLPDGSITLVWETVGQDPEYGIYARRFSAGNTPLGDEFHVNEYTTDSQVSPIIASDAAGNFLIAWMNAAVGSSNVNGVRARRYSPDGVPQGTEFYVHSMAAAFHGYPSVSASSNGDFVVAWGSAIQDGSGYGIYAQRYDAAPSLVAKGLADVTTFEDAAAESIDLQRAFYDPQDAGATLSFSVVGNTNSALFTSASISAGQLLLEFAPEASGTSTLKIRAANSSGSVVESEFNVTVLAINDAPTLVVNSGPVVLEGNSQVLSAANLWATDLDNGPGEITYRIISLPTVGTLQKNLSTLPQYGTFTQQDILDGLIRYVHPGNEVVTDAFGFQLSDNAMSAATVRVSLNSSGAESDNEAKNPSFSASGRYVAFESLATNLVSGDANGVSDIFVRDLFTGVTTRVSLSSTGADANGASTDAAISADGRFVAFQSDASNLVAGDTNGVRDVFVRDLQLGVTTRVSLGTGGVQADRLSGNPSISADGRFIAFDTQAGNIGASNVLGGSHVFVRDVKLGISSLVSVNSSGVQANSVSGGSAISSNGRYVAFTSVATNLAPADSSINDVYLRDLQLSTTTRISINAAGDGGNGNSEKPSISANGRVIAYESSASDLTPNDTNGFRDVFVYRADTNTTERISVSLAGAEAASLSDLAHVTSDGRHVIFESDSSVLVSGDTNGRRDIFKRTIEPAALGRVSLSYNDTQSSSGALAPNVSADGRFVGFMSTSTQLVAGDTNGQFDLFVRDTGVVSATTNVSITPVNDAPTLNAISNPAPINMNAPQQTVAFSGVTTGGGESQVLSITATSSNPAIIPDPQVIYTSPSFGGSLKFTPVTNATGTVVITVTVRDNGGVANGGVDSVSRTFSVEVRDMTSPVVSNVYAADSLGVNAARPIQQGERLATSVPGLVVVFSEGMSTTGMSIIASAHNWRLKRNGVEIINQVSGITFGLNPATSRYEALLAFSSPLGNGSYELTARSTLTDLAGHRLDGDADGSGWGEDYVHRFTVGTLLISGSEFRVNTTLDYDQRLDNAKQAVAFDAAGNFVVTWASIQQDGSLTGVFAQRFNSGGAALGSEFQVNTYTTSWQGGNLDLNQSVAMSANGTFVIVWDSDSQDGSAEGVFGQRFSAGGVKLGSEFQISTFTYGRQNQSAIAMDPDGDFVVTWQSYHDFGYAGVYAQRFNASGVKQGSEFLVNTYTSFEQRNPAVASDSAGNFVIAWKSNQQDGSQSGIYAQRYSAAGVRQGSEFRVNSYTTWLQERPDVAMDSAGNFVVTWASYDEDGVSIHSAAQRFNAAGVPQGSEFLISTATGVVQAAANVAMEADGDFAIAWGSDLGDGNGGHVFLQRYDATGATIGSELQFSTNPASQHWNPSLAMNDQGLIIAVAQGSDESGAGIFARRFSPAGTVTSVTVAGDATPIEAGRRLMRELPALPVLAVNFSFDMSQLGGASGANSVSNVQNWQLTKNGQAVSNPFTSISVSGKVATLSLSTPLDSGNYVLTARDTIKVADGSNLDGDGEGTPGGNFVRAFSIKPAVEASDELRVNSYTTGAQGGANFAAQAIAADAAGNYVTTWTSAGQDGSSDGVYAQRFNAAGVPLGSEFSVNSSTTGQQHTSSVARAAHGDFVITWTDSGGSGSSHLGIFAQRFNAEGVPQGSEFRVNTYTSNTIILSTTAMDADGDFAVTWSSLNQDGGGYGVYAQRFDAAGTMQGSEFRVNSYTTGNQRNSVVAMEAGGDFVVVWQSFGQDGSDYGVYARRFTAAGASIGSEFRVNSATTSAQRSPDVAMDVDGDFVVVWASMTDGSGAGIYARRFDSTGAVKGSDFLVNSYTSNAQVEPRVASDRDGDFVVAWSSASQDLGGYGVFAQLYGASGARQGSEFRVNVVTSGDQHYADVAMDADGDFAVAWASQDQDGLGVFARRYSGDPQLTLLSSTPTYSGFELAFNRPFTASELNLFDQENTLGPADVTLTGASVGLVRGSVVVAPGSQKLNFIKSGGPLAADTYTISLRSASTGFVDHSGNLLDGNGDGFTSDNYTSRFTIAQPPTGITLAIGDVVRGYAQTIDLPAIAGNGLPITISNAQSVKSVSFALVYNPALLTISGAALSPEIMGTISVDTSLVGVARITVNSADELSATGGPKTLVTLSAAVPGDAAYGSKQILGLSSIEITNSHLQRVPSIGDEGIQIVAFLGDANGSQTYNAPDATISQRLIVGTETGLAAYQLADPNLIVDINGNGQIQSDDVTQIQRAIVGLFTNEIPVLSIVAAATPTGTDPLVFIRQDLSTGVGQTITVPVELLVTELTGIALTGVDLAIAYDATRLELDAVKLGELLVGFGLNANLSTPGVIKLSLSASLPLTLPFDRGGVLAELDFKVLSGSGPTRINLLSEAESLQTALYDDLGRSLLLQPAPSNQDDDSVDGLIEILAADQVAALGR